MDHNKLKQLQVLKERMEQDFRSQFPDSRLWFFSNENKVDGYWGTDAVMFVGIRPSTGKGGFARPTFNAFYDLLERHGFAHAHVTDLVKESMEVGYPSDAQVDRNWPYFLEELSIVDPIVVVALGRWVFDELHKRWDRLVPLRRVTHYAFRYGSRSKIGQQLDEEFQRLRKDLGGWQGRYQP